MSVLYLTEDEVASLLDMPTAIDVVETAFHESAAGRTHNILRQRAKAPGIVLHMIGAAAEYLGYVGWKCYTTTGRGANFHFGLYEATSGDLVALMEADRLGWFRTAATSGVAIKYLTQPDVNELGLFGAGWQARGQLIAAANVRPLKRVCVYSRDEQRRMQFAAEMSGELNVEVRAVDRPEFAVVNFPLVITATTSRAPVFSGDDLPPGTTVCAMGSNWLDKAEIDVQTVRRAGRIVCDNIAACQHEAGDFVEPIKQGVFDGGNAVELSQIVAGQMTGRTSRDEIVLFKSVGLAMEDVALAATVLDRAKQRSVGAQLPI